MTSLFYSNLDSASIVYTEMGKEAMSIPYSAVLPSYMFAVKLVGYISSHLMAPPDICALLFLKVF